LWGNLVSAQNCPKAAPPAQPIEEGAFMPRELSTPLPQPVFNEGNVTPDPRQFKTKHPSDNQQYKEIEKLLTKDVVAFDQSRMQPGDVYSLAAALGPHGTESVQQIKQTGQIVFHCAGDTGASSEGKYGNELRVSDQVTADCRASDATNRPAFFYHLGDVVYNFGESKYYSRFPATTIPSSSRELRRRARR
jgi:hypothetical protein